VEFAFVSDAFLRQEQFNLLNKVTSKAVIRRDRRLSVKI
jgi:hypothetical protein